MVPLSSRHIRRKDLKKTFRLSFYFFCIYVYSESYTTCTRTTKRGRRAYSTRTQTCCPFVSPGKRFVLLHHCRDVRPWNVNGLYLNKGVCKRLSIFCGKKVSASSCPILSWNSRPKSLTWKKCGSFLVGLDNISIFTVITS